MILNEQTQELLNTALQVFFFSLALSIPFVIALGLLYLYQGYKKRKKESKEKPDRIVVKMNREQGFDTYMISGTEDQMKHFFGQLDKYIKPEAENPDDSAEDKPSKPLAAMYTKELQALAKEKGIRGYSRMNKEKLIEVLKGP